jgi:hypothetical protein
VKKAQKLNPEQLPVAVVIDPLSLGRWRLLDNAQHMLRQPLAKGVAGGFGRQDKGACSHDDGLTHYLPFGPLRKMG